MTGPDVGRWGTEISFRLGPGTGEDARRLAATLAGLATGCLEHVLFLDEDAGEYGCLAVWPSEEAAAAYGDVPDVRNVVGHLEEITGKAPRIRRYRMEYQPVP